MKDDSVSSGQIMHGKISRRRFLAVAGTISIGVGLGGCTKWTKEAPRFLDKRDLEPGALPAKGYLLVDTKKCQG